MYLDKAHWEKHFKGFWIMDATLSREGCYWFVLSEKLSDSELMNRHPRTRIVFGNQANPMQERFLSTEFDCFYKTSIAFQSLPVREAVAVDNMDHVYSFNASMYGADTRIQLAWLDGKRSASVRRVKQLFGTAYAVASDRMILKRSGIGQWQLDQGLPRPAARIDDSQIPMDFGFSDIAAFSADDVYAVGGLGEVWHRHKGEWRELAFPSRDLLCTVCCGGDGNVYITGKGGALWVGGATKWTRLLDAWCSSAIQDSVWFANTLWCGNEQGLWFLKEGKLVPISVQQPEEISGSCGRLDISPDGQYMLSMSPVGAALYDGEKWSVLFNTLEFID